MTDYSDRTFRRLEREAALDDRMDASLRRVEIKEMLLAAMPYDARRSFGGQDARANQMRRALEYVVEAIRAEGK